MSIQNYYFFIIFDKISYKYIFLSNVIEFEAIISHFTSQF